MRERAIARRLAGRRLKRRRTHGSTVLRAVQRSEVAVEGPPRSTERTSLLGIETCIVEPGIPDQLHRRVYAVERLQSRCELRRHGQCSTEPRRELRMSWHRVRPDLQNVADAIVALSTPQLVSADSGPWSTVWAWLTPYLQRGGLKDDRRDLRRARHVGLRVSTPGRDDVTCPAETVRSFPAEGNGLQLCPPRQAWMAQSCRPSPTVASSIIRSPTKPQAPPSYRSAGPGSYWSGSPVTAAIRTGLELGWRHWRSRTHRTE